MYIKVVLPVFNLLPQQSEMLTNQLREITGIQDPQILYRALNVSPEKPSAAHRMPAFGQCTVNLRLFLRLWESCSIFSVSSVTLITSL